MRMVRFDRVGDPGEVLACVDAPVPDPAPGQVRVRITARPVNPSDLLFVRGRYGRRPALPSPVGFEAVGVVETAGEGGGPPPGTRVAVDAFGTWQDQVVTEPGGLTVVPDDISDETACQLMINPATALLLLRLARLRPGQWLALNAAASAVGRGVISLAAREGVRCLALVRDRRHTALLESLGAVVIDDSPAAVPESAERLPGSGAAVALDAVGGAATTRLARCLSDGGRLICYGMLAEDPAVVPVEDLVFRSVQVSGFWLPEHLRKLTAAQRAELGDEVIAAVRSGAVATDVAARFPLSDVRDAVQQAARPGRTGKVLLVS